MMPARGCVAGVSQVHTNVNIPPHPTQDVTEHADVSQVHTNVNMTWRADGVWLQKRAKCWRGFPPAGISFIPSFPTKGQPESKT